MKSDLGISPGVTKSGGKRRGNISLLTTVFDDERTEIGEIDLKRWWLEEIISSSS